MARRAVTDNGHEDPGAASTVVQVAVGEAHSLALTASGSLYTWGQGQFGRMGLGVFQDELVPTQVEIAAMAVDDDWDPASEPSRISQIAAGAYHSLALSGDGIVWSWGFNACQLGREGPASYPAPISFLRPSSFSFDDGHDSRNTDEVTQVVVVEAGGMMSSAIDKDGGLWLWGTVPEPSAGVQITDSDAHQKSDAFQLANIDRPARVLALRDQRVRRVVCGNEHILALVEDRRNGSGVECYAWGSNSCGQLGLGDFEARDTPTFVTLRCNTSNTIVDFACGAFHSVVVTMISDHGDDVDGPETESDSSSSVARKLPHLMDQVMRARVTPDMESLASPRTRSRQPGGYSYNYNGRNQSSFGSNGSSRAYSQSSMTSWMGNTSGRVLARDGGFMAGDPQGVTYPGGDHDRLSTCWTFGQGENGQLGHGACASSPTPMAVDALPTRDRIQAAVCGLFHTAVVTESGDVWVWGMEGGLGQCPGIGPPGSKSGDALTPVRVFGESSATCNPSTGAKGIACGAAHTVTVSNGGTDLWAWGRGKNGVLGLGHPSDSWFPSPVVWPPGVAEFTSDADGSLYPDLRKSSSRASSRGRGDEIRPYVIRELEDYSMPPRSSSSYGPRVEQTYVEDRPPRAGPYSNLNRKGLESRRGEHAFTVPACYPSRRAPAATLDLRAGGGTQSPSASSLRRGDTHFGSPTAPDSETNHHRSFRRETLGAYHAEDAVASLKTELVDCRRYAESLHAAVYGGVDSFALHLPRHTSSAYYYNPRFSARKAMHRKSSALQDWQQHVEDAPLEELAQLELFYKSMRNQLKDVLFQRRMEAWCRRTVSGISASAYQEPPPVRDPYSVQSTPYFDGPDELALRMSGILSDRGEVLPPAVLAASLAELRMRFQRLR